MAGVAWGIMDKENWDELQTCAKDADIFSVSILTAYHLMSEGGIRNKEAGMRLMVSTIDQLPIYLNDCHSMSEDMAEFKTWASLFLDPVTAKATIQANLKSHLPVLTLDLKRVEGDLSRGEYFQAGSQLGVMVVILTTPESSDLWLQ
jgi:hypothetical protein